MSDQQKLNLFLTSLASKCPNCGKGKLFAGFLDLRSSCDQCQQDYSFADSGDGPAFLIIILVGFIAVGGALTLDVMFAIPYWLHLVIWLPLILILSIGLLRPLKAMMIALQFHNDARPGQKQDEKPQTNRVAKAGKKR